MAEPDLPSSCSPAVALKLGAAQAYMQAWWQGVARVTVGLQKLQSDCRDYGGLCGRSPCTRQAASVPFNSLQGRMQPQVTAESILGAV